MWECWYVFSYCWYWFYLIWIFLLLTAKEKGSALYISCITLSYALSFHILTCFCFLHWFLLYSQVCFGCQVKSRPVRSDGRWNACLRAEWEWELVPLLPGKKAVGCQEVYTVKLNPNRCLARLDAHLVAKEQSQTYGVDYHNRFSPIAKMTSIWLLVSLATIHNWTLHQLDIKNSILHGILNEEFIWSNHLSLWLKEYGKVCHFYESHFMPWNNLLKPGLDGLVPLFKSLVFITLKRITLFSLAFIRKNICS